MAYRGRWFVRLREYVCGDHIETDIYPVFQQPGRRREKCKPSSEVRKKQNQRDRERRLVRILRMNFTKEDYALHLTYAEKPESLADAQRMLKNFLDRLKRRYKKAGKELKYLYTTEYGKTTGRVHHHLVISGGLTREEIETAWGHGYANCDRLQFEDGLESLAKYLCKGPATYRAWTPSRNLVMPEPLVRDGAVSLEEMGKILDAIDEKNAWQYFETVYPGYECIRAVYDKNEVSGGVYIRVQMRKKEEKPLRHGRRGLVCMAGKEVE